jgi:hypothetical protein
MIITNIFGGLGNQMFQYAIAKSIAVKNKDVFKLDITLFEIYLKSHGYDYGFRLDQFNIEENIATIYEIKNLKGYDGFFRKIANKLHLNIDRPKSYFFEEKNMLALFDDNVFNYNNIYLHGYWQNELYFLDIRDEILNDFSLKKPISKEAKKYMLDINTSESVSIHIRRADYVSDEKTNKIHGFIGMDYYKHAIKFINESINSPMYYIFSDDIDWCKENLDFLEGKIFVDDTINPTDDLELMKNCKHNIIANSSFSWWGAWLNENVSKVVIAPKIWLVSSPNFHIAPKSWIKI